MKNRSQRLFVYELILALFILVISLSVVNTLFIRTMTQHQRNQALMKMSEKMVLLSESIQNPNYELKELFYYFDQDGNHQTTQGSYELKLEIENKENYQLIHLVLRSNTNEELLSWDIVKVVE